MSRWNESEGFEPKTAYDINECSTPQGIRRYVEHAVYRARVSPTLYYAFEQARTLGLSGEDKWTLIAFNALCAEERIRKQHLDHMERCIGPIFLEKP